MTIAFDIRRAAAGDRDAMLALLPRLASFDLPDRRRPQDLWQGDEKLMRKALDGQAPECYIQVAIEGGSDLLGLAMYTLRAEILTHEPSAHLETLVVSEHAQGRGVGSALLRSAETHAFELGARSMSLHVFGVNDRARAVYARAGYDGELIRCIKWLDQ